MTKASTSEDRKTVFEDEKPRQWNLLVLWEWEGALKKSPMFYGYYGGETNTENTKGFTYRLPLAYFMAGLGVYVYSFVATLRK